MPDNLLPPEKPAPVAKRPQTEHEADGTEPARKESAVEVICDETNNSPVDVEAGRVNVTIKEPD